MIIMVLLLEDVLLGEFGSGGEQLGLLLAGGNSHVGWENYCSLLRRRSVTSLVHLLGIGGVLCLLLVRLLMVLELLWRHWTLLLALVVLKCCGRLGQGVLFGD